MSDEILKQLQKGQEGTMLALGAVAEVLQKMDSRLEKAESYETQTEMAQIEKAEFEKAMQERTALVKDVASAVVAMLKGEQGMPVDGRTPTAVSHENDKWPMATRKPAEDQEKAVALRTATEEVQKPIQAMDKKDEEKEEDKDKKEYPMEEDEEKETPVRKALAELKKQHEDLLKSLPTLIQKEAESRLRKMGVIEERSLAPSRTHSLGADDIQLRKSADEGDLADKLASIPTRTLRQWQFQIESGNTDGVPAEVVQAMRRA